MGHAVLQEQGFEPESSKGEEWNLGKYLVQGAGHYSTCHTPRNFLGGEKLSEFLHGSNLGRRLGIT
ncbi:hypothetical protein [Breoghania sp.]|uniref:hypothetical protein n=1 Tax=Breoghania sp. TaxID=2065378 RepID=UPI002620F238|nr:hypothetical protein [Breoghania sp.]MDJ0931008.1 hypothetical protein [Breoghania sp.]